MYLTGRVENGVVVFAGEVKLPEGVVVTVFYPKEPVIHIAPHQREVIFPLVPSASPGSVHLTSSRIADILDEEDVPS